MFATIKHYLLTSNYLAESKAFLMYFQIHSVPLFVS